jgi:hypothetical protein
MSDAPERFGGEPLADSVALNGPASSADQSARRAVSPTSLATKLSGVAENVGGSAVRPKTKRRDKTSPSFEDGGAKRSY